jgi:antigen flippase
MEHVVQEEAPAVAAPKKSYGQALKSSALIGASSMIDIGFRVVRTKAIALLLGPDGVGLLGIYTNITELVRSLAGLGVNSSGVRQIAEAVGTGDAARIARTVTTLRRVAFWSGAIGSLLLLVFSKWVALLTFGNDSRAGAIALLAVAVFCADIAAAQGALVQGMRRIADLAKINVFGAFYGTLFGIPIVYFFRERGLVPSLVCVAAMSILTSWWYARKVQVQNVRLSFREVAAESSSLLKLGLAFMSASLMGMAAVYLVRIIIARRLGVAEAGYFQSAWALSGIYAGFILNSMVADFYPRLTAVAKDNGEVNRLVNEQAEVGLLLAGPGLFGTLVFAPLVIDIFYSARFQPAVEILRWICLGMMLRIGSWPMGIVLLAKGVGKIYFLWELASNTAFVSLIGAGVLVFGLKGSGIGFFAMYVFYWVGIYILVRHLTGFRWSAANGRWALIFVPLLGAVFVGQYFLPPGIQLAFGLGILGFCSFYSVRALCTLVSPERLPPIARKGLKLLRLMP